MLLELSKENEQLRASNDELTAQLQDRNLAISEAGSLAEAALQLNAVFRAAQDACDQYTYNMQLHCQRMEEETKDKCMLMLSESEHQLGLYEKDDCE